MRERESERESEKMTHLRVPRRALDSNWPSVAEPEEEFGDRGATTGEGEERRKKRRKRDESQGERKGEKERGRKGGRGNKRGREGEKDGERKVIKNELK